MTACTYFSIEFITFSTKCNFAIVNLKYVCYNESVNHKQMKGAILSMEKRFSTLTAIMLCIAMIFCFASCTNVTEDEEEFVAATLAIDSDIPVSHGEIIDFYNTIITALQAKDAFTAKNKPGIKYSESLSANNINILAYDAATGEATEDGKLDALNASANAIKNRIIDGIPTGSTVVGFGDMATEFSTIIHPGTGVSALTADNVVSAECHVDGSKLYITINLAGNVETAANVYGIKDKATVIADFNSYSADYAEVTDYSVSYVEDAETNTYSTINLTVEVEKQDDGTYACTGRIMSLEIKALTDVSAIVSCKGSFADNGDIQVNFRLTNNKYYEFDWLGTETWEPAVESVTE